MAIFRRSKSDDAASGDGSAAEAPVVEVEGVRAQGPFDISERSPEGQSAYVNFGPLKVRGRVGFEVRVQADANSEHVNALLLVTQDAGLELRAFASSRSGGLWEDVRAELIAEVERLEGTYEVIEGQYGPELHLRIPATSKDGEPGFQPSRIVVVEGPRWMLRGTFLGQAALEPADDHILFQALREIIVDRGSEAMAMREPLHLDLPVNRVVVDPDAAGPATAAAQAEQAQGEQAQAEQAQVDDAAPDEK